MACVVNYVSGSCDFQWLVILNRYKNHRENYAFIVMTKTANIIELLPLIKPAFVEAECGEFCTAVLKSKGRFVKAYIIIHDRYKDGLAPCLCPFDAPVEITGKGSMYYDAK